MDVDIARALGEILALQTGELNKDPYDQNALNRIRLISETYGNFVGAEFSGFKVAFEAGYQEAQRDVRRDQGVYLEDDDPGLQDFDGPKP